MADETFEAFVDRERARLHAEREAVFTQQQDLESKLDQIERELARSTHTRRPRPARRRRDRARRAAANLGRAAAASATSF